MWLMILAIVSQVLQTVSWTLFSITFMQGTEWIGGGFIIAFMVLLSAACIRSWNRHPTSLKMVNTTMLVAAFRCVQ